jgi:hypothetical protein
LDKSRPFAKGAVDIESHTFAPEAGGFHWGRRDFPPQPKFPIEGAMSAGVHSLEELEIQLIDAKLGLALAEQKNAVCPNQMPARIPQTACFASTAGA